MSAGYPVFSLTRATMALVISAAMGPPSPERAVSPFAEGAASAGAIAVTGTGAAAGFTAAAGLAAGAVFPGRTETEVGLPASLMRRVFCTTSSTGSGIPETSRSHWALRPGSETRGSGALQVRLSRVIAIWEPNPAPRRRAYSMS